MAKENKPASAYAKPHTMSGKAVTLDQKYTPGAKVMGEMNPSVGGISKGNYKAPKSEGVVTRGNGAATKGTKARGPMA